MKHALALSALAIAATLGSSLATSSEAEARGWRHRHHLGIGFVRVAPVYPVYSYCRWYRTPYGPVRRCFY